MILLDTNVVSALISSERDEAADDWLDRMDPAELWLPTLVVRELKYGIDIMEDGRRRKRMESAFRKLIDIAFVDRIVGFDIDAAIAAAAIGADRKKRGRPSGEVDTLLAGIAVSRKASIATRNVRPFADLPVTVIDPWAGGKR